MDLWLDDLRDPERHQHRGWYWVMTAADAIKVLRNERVERASLDHDLTYQQMERGGYYARIEDDGVMSGYDVLLWLEENPQYWPPEGVAVHTGNPAGAQRMQAAIVKHYGRTFQF
jgi:hypothetical protein